MQATTQKPINTSTRDAPIGVFDSGIGGLSVLRHILALLPRENVIYFSDAGFAPYGDKPARAIISRSLSITDFLLTRGIKALAVPCNTATGAAIHVLREHYPSLPVVGVEPGLKPAIELTRTRIVGVLATKGTLASAKFHHLQNYLTRTAGVSFLPQACIGLADQIESGKLHSRTTAKLVHRYVAPLIEQGVDTLVLGCTHYPFVQHFIEKSALGATRAPIPVVDTGEAVARQVARRLLECQLQSTTTGQGGLEVVTTGNPSPLRAAFSNLLGMQLFVKKVVV